MKTTSSIAMPHHLLIPLFCGLLCLAIVHSEETAPPTHGMMIDAGSGGSRLHVFEWEKVRINFVPTVMRYIFE